ncbi:MAG TPA: rRNA maturation RNase YbeY [Syntrophales bacterium]|nr:rRNA maturation RNase YbeY [Syntrophales bacterium]HNS53211.1 rRNA maturation RNase YbeY [Syntrophales bacterium]
MRTEDLRQRRSTSRAGAVRIASRQKSATIDRAGLRRDVRKILALLGLGDRELSLLLVDDEGIRALNRQWLRRDRPTNVISFSLSEGDFGGLNPGVLGDVAVSVEAARREALAAAIPFEDALLNLVLHGILHLAGYAHEGPGNRARARVMAAVQEAVFFEIRGYRLDVSL